MSSGDEHGLRRFTRREVLLTGASGVGMIAVGGYGISRVLGDSHDGADYVLRPAPATVELGARTAQTWSYNGGLPAPELRAKQGERFRVRVENGLPEETSIHWHGVRLANPMDGVPGTTQQPILSGRKFLYDFVPPDAGTFFFHPHVGTQLDRGLYGALIVEPRNETLSYDREATLVLDDWLDGLDGRSPDKQLAELEKKGMQMGAMSGMDMSGMARMGKAHKSSGDMVHLDLDRMKPAAGTLPKLANLLESGAADAGDVKYPLHLINGHPPGDPFGIEVSSGERLRLRLVNAASDTIYCFYVQDHPLTVVASDGQEVDPRLTDAVVLGMGERADVMLDAAKPGAYRVIASALGKNARAEAVLRYSQTPRSSVPAATAMMQKTRIVSYSDLRDQSGAEPLRKPREIRVDLDMDMRAPYRWTMGGQAFPKADPIRAERGERLRFVVRNLTMMPHPMHVHGHFFRLASGDGTGARKDTILVAPKQSVKLDLVADNPGRWMFHCHNLYHQMAGMMRVLEIGA